MPRNGNKSGADDSKQGLLSGGADTPMTGCPRASAALMAALMCSNCALRPGLWFTLALPRRAEAFGLQKLAHHHVTDSVTLLLQWLGQHAKGLAVPVQR
jgi:hypothetical protein